MAYLPSERLSQLKWVVAASIIPGFVDLASVAVIARLMGALVGTRLGDGVPGVKVFGGDAVDQGLWLIAIFALLSWIGSFGKLGLQFLQQRLTARLGHNRAGVVAAGPARIDEKARRVVQGSVEWTVTTPTAIIGRRAPHTPRTCTVGIAQ